MPSPITKFFSYTALPQALQEEIQQEVIKPIAELARKLDGQFPDSAEKTVGLRKLLEAKDCFIRAKL